jgi:DNA-binding beta-propeller fold protein YncE
MIRRVFVMLLCMALLGVVSACGGGASTSRFSGSFARIPSGRMIISVEDADTPSHVYDSGQILLREPGAIDTVTLLDLPLPEAGSGEQIASFAQILTPTSMQGSPSCISVSADGSRALVTSRMGPAPAEGVEVGQLPPSKVVTLLDLTDGRGRVIESYALCAQPSAVSFDPSGTRAAVIGRGASELVIVEVRQTRFGSSYRLRLEQLFGEGCEPTDVAWHPSEDVVAVTMGGAGVVAFFGVLDDPRDTFATELIGSVEAGDYPSVARWMPDGGALIVADSRWESEFFNRYIPEGSGAIHVVVPPDGGVDASVRVSVELPVAPSSIAVAPGGALIASVSRDRRGGRGELRLYAFDGASLAHAASAATGGLAMDVAFDTSGRGVLVGEFESGAIEVFEVIDSAGVVGLSARTMRVETNYGLHALRVVR